MSPEQRLEYEQLKATVGKLERAEIPAFIESLYRRLEARIDEKIAAITLNDLSDVNTTGVADGQVIKYDSASETWIDSDDLTA